MEFPFRYALAAVLLLGATVCGGAVFGQAQSQVVGKTRSGLNPADFHTEIGGRQTALYILANASGAEVCVSNFGARIVSAMFPDRMGVLRDVVLGFDDLAGYRRASDVGATIGRVVNRIAHGRYVLDGDTVRLPRNSFGHCIHGGHEGWDRKVWEVTAATPDSVAMRLLSPDGEEGFPGNITIQVTYSLREDNTLGIRYEAVTDRPTVINPTNHTYFCLSGAPGRGSVDDILQIAAQSYTPADSTFLTTGEIVPLAGTPLDFRQPQRIGEHIHDFTFEQLHYTRGYDQNWVLDAAGEITQCAAKLVSPESGIAMEVFTDQPGLQLYTGNFLNGTLRGKGGTAYGQHAAVCLETQHYPDSPNKPHWPTVVLRPGERFVSRTLFRFSAE